MHLDSSLKKGDVEKIKVLPKLENRGLNFVRYADDVVIFCRKEQSANRVMRNTVRYIETKLHLKVNATKTRVSKPTNLKYLGYSFWKNTKSKEWKARPHRDSFLRPKRKLKKLLCRSWSIDLAYRISKINQSLVGWINYYKLGNMTCKLRNFGS